MQNRFYVHTGYLVIAATMIALITANSPLQTSYHNLIHGMVGVHYQDLYFSKSLLDWVNEGLMAVFFYSVTSEIRVAFSTGPLADRRTAIVPAAGAVMGIALPALIYYGINVSDTVVMKGWAIPTATDIAFSLAVLFLMSKSVSEQLRAMLMTIAVIDDLVAILVIAIFYSSTISLSLLGFALVPVVTMVILRFCNVKDISFYLFLTVILWLLVLKSGVHATLAGVLMALLVPNKTLALHHESTELWSLYFVMPVFAFMNAGVTLNLPISEVLDSRLFNGIVWGLLIGKPLGISGTVWLCQKCFLHKKILQTSEIFALGFLCAIGFTMSLFIGSLAFPDTMQQYADITRMAVISASSIAALIAFLVFKLGFLYGQNK